MNKYNKQGMELLSYKEELLNEAYSPIIRKSLELAVDQMQMEALIDVDIHFALKDVQTPYEDFASLVLEKPSLMKTNDELLVEYEALREEFERTLMERTYLKELPEGVSVTTESKVKTEQIHVITTFSIDQDFVSEYFGVTDETELVGLMKPKGFVGWWVVMRFSKFMKDFLQQYDNYANAQVALAPNVTLAASPVYYNTDNNTYCSDFMLYLDVEAMETSERYEEISEHAEQEIQKVVAYISERLVA